MLRYIVQNRLRHVKFMLNKSQRHATMSALVGGHYDAIGKLEMTLLKNYGLEKHHKIIDVGCGSGRLATQLTTFLSGQYIGLDIDKIALRYGQKQCARDDWKFYKAPGLTIPEEEASADFVCFFSVMTHLPHAASFQYLQEAARVVKPGGLVFVSFIEFCNPQHWKFFEGQLKVKKYEKTLNQFLSKDAFETWADKLGLDIVAIHDSRKPFIKLDEPVALENGTTFTEIGNLGQSVCVLQRPVTEN